MGSENGGRRRVPPFLGVLETRTSWRSSQNGGHSLLGDIELRSTAEALEGGSGETHFLRSLFGGSNSLFSRINSLFGLKKFPVRVRREFPRKCPKVRAEFGLKSARKPRIRGYSLYFSLLAGNSALGDEFATDWHRRQLVRLCMGLPRTRRTRSFPAIPRCFARGRPVRRGTGELAERDPTRGSDPRLARPTRSSN